MGQIFTKQEYSRLYIVKFHLAFADEKIYLPEKLKFLLGRIGNIIGKGSLPAFSLSLYNVLTLSQTTNFRLFRTERVCRQQLKSDENGRKFFKRV